MYLKRLYKLHKSQKATQLKLEGKYVVLFTGTKTIKKANVKHLLEHRLSVVITKLNKIVDYKRGFTKVIIKTAEPMSWVN